MIAHQRLPVALSDMLIKCDNHHIPMRKYLLIHHGNRMFYPNKQFVVQAAEQSDRREAVRFRLHADR